MNDQEINSALGHVEPQPITNDFSGLEVLKIAIKMGDKETIERLLKSVDVLDELATMNAMIEDSVLATKNDPDQDNVTVIVSDSHPIFAAAQKGDIELVWKLLPNCSADFCRYGPPILASNRTVVDMAIDYGHMELLGKLLDHNDSMNHVRDIHLDNYLFFALKHGNKSKSQGLSIAKTLIGRFPGRYLDGGDGTGFSLLTAARAGRRDVFEHLLNNIAWPCAAGTLVTRVLESRNVSMLERLLERFSAVRKLNPDLAPVELSSALPQLPHCVERSSRKKVAKALLEYGDGDAKDATRQHNILTTMDMLKQSQDYPALGMISLYLKR